LLLSLAMLASLAAAPAGPPTPEEERLFAEGLRAFDAGDARAAETTWKQGYALRADPAFLVRIGEAQEKRGAAREAAESYRRYLREAPDAADRPEIEQRIARLGPPPPEPAAPAPVPAARSIAPAARPPAAAVPAPAQAPPARPAVDTEESRDRAPAAREGAEPSGWNAFNTTAWIAVATTVALLGTSAFFAASAASRESDVNRLVTYRNQDTRAPLEYQAVAAQYESAYADGQHDDRLAKALLWGALGTAALAVTFFVVDGVREAPAQVTVIPSTDNRPGVGALGSWRWRF
jgi:hypothetical protein